MSCNYKFFQHKECEYFPCHKVANEDKFNCLFCYCPLYFTEDCGGNNKILEGGIKDCSGCMIPHSEKAYDYIIGKIMEINQAKKNNK